MDIYEVLEDQLWESFDETLKLLGENTKVIIANESGLEPVEDYLSIRVVDLKEVGSDKQQYLRHNETLNIAEGQTTTHYEIPVQITLSGEGSGGIAVKLSNNLKSLDEVRSIFRRNSLSILNKSSVRRVPHFSETKWRSVFKLDVVFSYAYKTTFSAEYADVIVIDNLVNKEKWCVNVKNKNYSCEVK